MSNKFITTYIENTYYIMYYWKIKITIVTSCLGKVLKEQGLLLFSSFPPLFFFLSSPQILKTFTSLSATHLLAFYVSRQTYTKAKSYCRPLEPIFFQMMEKGPWTSLPQREKLQYVLNQKYLSFCPCPNHGHSAQSSRWALGLPEALATFTRARPQHMAREALEHEWKVSNWAFLWSRDTTRMLWSYPCKFYGTKKHLPITSLFKINLWFIWVDYRFVRMNLEKKQKSGAPLTPVYLVPFHPLGKPKVWPKQGWRVFRITVTGCLTACSEDPPTVVGSWPCALWIILFPSKEKNKSVMGRTVIHPLPFSTLENWGPQSHLACPGR